MGIALARDGSMAARVFAIASSRAELPEVGTAGDIGRGTSPGGTSALRTALKIAIRMHVHCSFNSQSG